jgi:hypothetical protein
MGRARRVSARVHGRPSRGGRFVPASADYNQAMRSRRDRNSGVRGSPHSTLHSEPHLAVQAQDATLFPEVCPACRSRRVVLTSHPSNQYCCLVCALVWRDAELYAPTCDQSGMPTRRRPFDRLPRQTAWRRAERAESGRAAHRRYVLSAVLKIEWRIAGASPEDYALSHKLNSVSLCPKLRPNCHCAAGPLE